MTGKSFIFRFANVELREREFALTKAGETVAVEPKAFRVLLILLRSPGKLIAKQELLDAVWGEAAVTENSLARAVALLRKLLDDEAHTPRFIETVATVGYRFVGNVEMSEEGFVPGTAEGAIAEPSAERRQTTPVHPLRRTPGIRALYWVIGGFAATVGVVAAWWLASRTAAPVVEGVSQITDDGNRKVATGVVSDGSRVYFDEMRDGVQVLAVVAATGGESALVTNNVAGSFLVDYAPNPSRLLLSGGYNICFTALDSAPSSWAATQIGRARC